MFQRSNVLICMLKIFIAIIIVVHSSAAQTTDTGSDPNTAKNAGTLQSISPGDLVQVSVFGHPELSQQARVANDGTAQLPLLGEVALAGWTEPDAATLIEGRLRDGNLLPHPRVNVTISESASQNVSVIGEVQHPGVYPVAGSRPLLDVLSLAGGLTNTAASHIKIKRHSAPEQTIEVTFKDASEDALSSVNARVYPGDSVIVPRSGIVYVLGDVARPGGFIMRDGGRITLLQVMAEAGGTLPTAAAGHLTLLHKDNGNYEVSKTLDLGKIARGHDRDVELHESDIVFVPNNRLKSAFRSSGSIVQSAATAAIYAGIL